jgi:hypothetical protein
MAAAWLAGPARRTRFRERIGALLLASEARYVGEGYCFAPSMFATPADAAILRTYLKLWLPRIDRRYDQDWVLGALLHLDSVLGAGQARPFLGRNGLGQRWVRRMPWLPADPGHHHPCAARLCAYAHPATCHGPDATTGASPTQGCGRG